jgi:hypothetical protein
LYVACDGADWNWKFDTALYGIPWDFQADSDPCLNNWQGVVCGESNQVIKLSLSSYNLIGSLLPSLSAFSGLKTLLLNDNKLDGTIPADIFGLPIDTLNLESNLLTGAIPDLLCSMRDLTFLAIGENNFASGPIPQCFGDNKSFPT